MSSNIKEIDIESFLNYNAPHLSDGYVAQDPNGIWCWYENMPEADIEDEIWRSPDSMWQMLHIFNIKPEEDWTDTCYVIENGKWRKL